MACGEAECLVMPYINGSITDGGLREFLKRTETCKRCREELEIYFTVDVGIRQLNQGTGTYNIKGVLETALELSQQRMHTPGILETARYAMNTLCFQAMLVVLVLQFRMWRQRQKGTYIDG